MEMITEKSWEEFKDSGLLWWVNRSLHLFGWALVLQIDRAGEVEDAYPARCKFRGFSTEIEGIGFAKLTKFMTDNEVELSADCSGSEEETELG